MSTVLLIMLLFISIALTGLILIQQSEGGALGIGGGGGGGGFMSGRSAANSVSRMTGWLGAAFLVCSLLLSIVFNRENQAQSIIDDTNAVAPLTIDIDSGETTLPLNGENDAPATDDTLSETVAEETPSEPVEPKTE